MLTTLHRLMVTRFIKIHSIILKMNMSMYELTQPLYYAFISSISHRQCLKKSSALKTLAHQEKFTIREPEYIVHAT